jgi:glycosyltransferase involved in cell wall biosynthesis
MQSTLTRNAGPVGHAPPRGARVRVAFCVDGLVVGGTELNAVRTAERLDRDRFDLSVVTLTADGPLRARYEAAGIPVVPFPITSMYGASAWREGRRLRSYLRGVDVVHSHDMYSNVFATLWARAAGTPVVISSRRWEVFPRRSYALANNLAYRASDCVLANSPWVAGLVRGERVPAERVTVVPNFVDDKLFQILSDDERSAGRARLGIAANDIVFTCVARLRAEKDHETLIRAFGDLVRTVSNARLLLVGDGPEEHRLRQLVANLTLERSVIFAGHVAGASSVHALGDVSVLTSLHEGFPNSIVEAMANGRPVVASAVGGILDAVKDGESGYLVTPRNTDGLRDAMRTLALDAPLRARMGERGRAHAASHYRASAVVEGLIAEYLKLLKPIA